MSAELAARITAARAVNDDFKHEVDAWTEAGADRPDYASRAFRLSRVLDMLLAELEHGGIPAEVGGPVTIAPADLATMLGALGHAAAFLRERAAQWCEDCVR
ncbi:MAG: hypothetical protein ACLP52_14210, partial [Streptosporangiaceae bacterium]